MNRKAETKQTKKAKIVNATKERVANEFGQTSKVPTPFKGASTSRPTNIVRPEINWRTVAEKPNWMEWKYTPQVRVWQACALSLDIEPNSIKRTKDSWLTGPGIDQLFEDESFQSENEKKEFKSRQKILLNNLNSKENPLWFSPNPNRPNLGEISLPEFAAWCSCVEWSIPKELTTLAKKPNIQDEKSTPNRKQTRSNENRAFLQDCIDQGISPNIASIWQHIIANAGKQNFLFKTASKATATTVDGDRVERKNLRRVLDRIPKK